MRVTLVFGVNPAEHVPGQLIPAGPLVTVPDPVVATVSGYELAEKFAPTASAPFILTLQLAIPEQPPVHPAKV